MLYRITLFIFLLLDIIRIIFLVYPNDSDNENRIGSSDFFYLHIFY